MLSEFLTPVDLRIVDGGFIVLSEIRYYSAYLDHTVVIPAQHFTDLASVPRPLKAIVPTTTGKNREAAVVHDFLCDKVIQMVLGITQADADAVWREALEVKEVGFIARWGLWSGVRAYQWTKGLFR